MLLTLLRQAWLSIYCIKTLGVDVKGFHHTGLKIALTGHVTIYEPGKYIRLPNILLIKIFQDCGVFREVPEKLELEIVKNVLELIVCINNRNKQHICDGNGRWRTTLAQLFVYKPQPSTASCYQQITSGCCYIWNFSSPNHWRGRVL